MSLLFNFTGTSNRWCDSYSFEREEHQNKDLGILTETTYFCCSGHLGKDALNHEIICFPRQIPERCLEDRILRNSRSHKKFIAKYSHQQTHLGRCHISCSHSEYIINVKGPILNFQIKAHRRVSGPGRCTKICKQHNPVTPLSSSSGIWIY